MIINFLLRVSQPSPFLPVKKNVWIATNGQATKKFRRIILVKVYFVTLKPRVPRKIFTLTPTLSHRERASGSLSLWERVGVKAKINSNPPETSFLSGIIECYILTFNEYRYLKIQSHP